MRDATHRLRPVQHPDTAVSLETLGEPRGYRPTFPFAGEVIDDFHRRLASSTTRGACLDGLPIPGKLRREDALKLYECGYFADGDLLEFGTSRGLSSWILANSLIASGRGAGLTTMELSESRCVEARRNLEREGVAAVVEVLPGDANETCRRLAAEGRRFAFAFVDHSHSYEHVASACEHLDALLEVGSVVVFHDYNDPRNARQPDTGDPDDEYGVFTAVGEALDSGRFELLGVYGCCGVVRKAR